MYRRNEDMAVDGEIFNWAGKQVNGKRKVIRKTTNDNSKHFLYNVRKNGAAVKLLRYNHVTGNNGETTVWPMKGRVAYHYQPNEPLPSHNWEEYEWDYNEKIFKFRGHRITEQGSFTAYRTSVWTGAGTGTSISERNGHLGEVITLHNQSIEVIKDDNVTSVTGGINRENGHDVISVYGGVTGNNNTIAITFPRRDPITVNMEYGDGYMEWANLFSVKGDNNTIVFNIDHELFFKSGLNSGGWDRPISLIRVNGRNNKIYFNFTSRGKITFQSKMWEGQIRDKVWAGTEIYGEYHQIPNDDSHHGPLGEPWKFMLINAVNTANGNLLETGSPNRYFYKGVKPIPNQLFGRVRFNSNENERGKYIIETPIFSDAVRELVYPVDKPNTTRNFINNLTNLQLSTGIVNGFVTTLTNENTSIHHTRIDYNAAGLYFHGFVSRSVLTNHSDRSGSTILHTAHLVNTNNRNITFNLSNPITMNHRWHHPGNRLHNFITVLGSGNIITINLNAEVKFEYSSPDGPSRDAFIMAAPGNKIIINRGGNGNVVSQNPGIYNLGFEHITPYINASEETINNLRR